MFPDSMLGYHVLICSSLFSCFILSQHCFNGGWFDVSPRKETRAPCCLTAGHKVNGLFDFCQVVLMNGPMSSLSVQSVAFPPVIKIK